MGDADMPDHASERPPVSPRQRLLEALLESAVDYAIIGTDLDGLVTVWNKGAERVLGWTELEIIGQPASVFFTMDDRRAGVPLAEMRAALVSGRGSDERWHLRKDGSVFWANGEMMPLKDEAGTVQGFLKILRDRTAQRLAAEAQRADAEFMRSVLAASDDAIQVLDLDARVVFLSAGGQRTLEIEDVSRMAGRDWVGLWPRPEREAARAAVAAAKSGAKGQFRAQADTFAGNPRFWDVQVTPMFDAAGKPERLLAVSRDVTDTHRAETALREALGLNTLILNSSRDCIVVLDLEARTQFVSPGGIAAMEITDVPAILGLSWLRVWQGEDQIAARRAVAAARAGGTGRFQGFCATHAGTPKWWDVVISPLAGTDGQPERLVSIGRDITKQRLAEDAMRSSESNFRSLAQTLPNHVWTATADGALDWFNEGVYAYSGADAGSLDGNGWTLLVHPDDLPAADRNWADARARGVQYQTEFRLRRRDGAWRWHIARAVPVRDAAGAVQRWIGTNTDIEDQKAAEAALSDFAATLEQRVAQRSAELVRTQDALRQSQKMEAIGNLTGGVAHDFNNLLQVISGNLQLLARDIAGQDKAERRVRDAMAGVARGSKLASQLLAFGRRQPLAPKVVNLGRLLRNMDDILRRTLGEAVELETIVAPNLWNTLVDPGNVENALLNLAINARDAMDGRGRLTIEANNAELDAAYALMNDEVVPGHYVLLAVTDTGCGMTPEILAEVFEPFFTTKPEGKGSGLGLSMVYGFVKQSGGHIKIYSEPGHGTTIKIYLPRSSHAEEMLIDADTLPAIGGSETILVAEDDDPVREAVIEMLGDLGYRVLKAADAESALTIIESGVPIDLLFTDVVMPGPLKSTELARRARERLPNLGVLFTSGYTEDAIVHGGRLDPDVELISKPYTRTALARKLRHVLANRAQRGLDPPALPPPPPPEPQDDAASRAGLTFLVVEDDWLIREITVDMLQDLGHRAVEAGDAKSALDILAAEPIDVLVTDVGLSDLSGVTLAEHARAQHPTLPVIFATGHSEVEGVTQGPSMRVLTKPYTAASFAGVIEGITAWMADRG